MWKHKNITLFWQKYKRRLLRHVWLVRLVAGLLVITLSVGLLAIIAKPFLDIGAKMLIGPRIVASFFTGSTKALKGSNNRTNILLLGVDGEVQEGAQLTDTMIFISINSKSGDVAMLSLPRDIWLESLQAKINTAYYYGEQKSSGGGFALVKDAVYQITGQPIHYAILLDFTGFVKAIDLVGGIDVKVERSFKDERYPIPGKEADECDSDPEYRCRYETIQFERGVQHMDGQTALKFVRSRNAEGEEGTDFARSARQQKVILGFKEKLLSTKTLLSPTTLLELKKTFSEHVKLDQEISEEEVMGFANLFFSFVRGSNTLRVLTLDTGVEENPGFLINPPMKVYGQWVLIPRSGDWLEFQAFLEQKLVSDI